MRKEPPQAYQDWRHIVIRNMPHLSKPQAVGLAMWSFGIALTQACGLSTVTVFLASLLGKSEANLREQLRQWYRSASAKPGRKRAEIDVTSCFKPLLQWILRLWSAQEKALVVAADATTLGQRFTVLVISVVYRGCGIPVAWKIVKATEKGSWKPYWLALLEAIGKGVPSDWFVLVTSDRGLYAKWLYEAIVEVGWHPFMRINSQGFYQLNENSPFVSLHHLVTQVGQSWAGRVNCFKGDSLACTLLAHWEEGYAEPWLIVTDLAPQQANICWYGMRSWVECLFKDFKRGGLGWHQTKMSDPKRAERLWLAIAVATLWLVSVGGQAKAQLPASSLRVVVPAAADSQSAKSSDSFELSSSVASDDQADGAARIPQPSGSPQSLPCRLSCFRRGFLHILTAVIKGLPLPTGSFVPDYFSFAPG